MKTQTIAVLFGLSILLAGSAAADDLQVKWSYGMNNTAKAVVLSVNVADYNGDGFNDIAVGAKEDTLQGSAGWVYLLNNDGTPKWEHDVPGAVSAMIDGNLTSDGKQSIIAGVSSRIYVFDGNGDSRQISLGDLTYKATSMLVTDLNNDGSKELVVIGGSQEKGKVFIFDKDLRLPYSKDTLGSPAAMAVSDINGDGLQEIVVGTVGRDNEYPAYVQAFSSKADKLWTYKTMKGVQSLTILDMKGDGKKEIIVGSKDKLIVLSADGQELEVKENITRPGYLFDRILVTDLNNDGEEEIVLGCTNTVYLYDKTLTNLKWKYAVGPAVFDIDAMDIDGDGFKEIAIASDILYIINKDGTLVSSFNAKTPRFSVRDIYIGDINYDTYPEIIIGATDSKVYVLGSTAQSKKMDANNLRKRGIEQYAERDYADAKTSIRSAMEAYKALGDSAMAQNMTLYLQKIMNEEAKVANQSADSQTYLDNAYNAFNDSDYVKAIENARIAKAKYMNINPKDTHIKSADAIINNSINSLRFAAENYLDNATAYVDRKDYEKALQYAKNASEAYAFLSDDANYAKSQAIINASKQALGITAETTGGQQPTGTDISSLMPILIGIAVIVIVSLIAVYALKSRKKTKEADEPEDSVLDKMEKERPKEKKKEIREHHSVKQEEPKHWIKEVDEAMKESSKGERTAGESRETPAAHKHRKTMKKITKDNYRGEGISLRNLSCRSSEEDIRD